MADPESSNTGATSLTNYCSFRDTRTGKERIGHYDESTATIQPLAHRSGTWLSTLYEVIEVGKEGIIASGEPIQRSSTRILAPVNGRDILCVGKNYAEARDLAHHYSDTLLTETVACEGIQQGKQCSRTSSISTEIGLTDMDSLATTAQTRSISQRTP